MFTGIGERGYLDLIRHIIEDGEHRVDRTGVGTRMIPHSVLEFDLEDEFPLITTKRVFFKGVVHELLWMLRGDGNIKYLNDNGVTIWDEWADMNGDLGPIYGVQWRKWMNMKGECIDQIAGVVDNIKQAPYSRRHLVSAWNVGEIDDMNLPPCHFAFQFTVFKNRLNCHLYQRSQDIGLGAPFNIASYALLTMMVAHLTGYDAGKLFMTVADAHIYENHVEQLGVQMNREPLQFPGLKLTRTHSHIDDFTFDSFELIDYKSHDPIKMSIAV